eukprot:3517239-Pyramimonas_sp.AAC.1
MVRPKVVAIPWGVLQFAMKARTVKNHDARKSSHNFEAFNPTVHLSPDEGGDVIPHLAYAGSSRPPAFV